MNGHQLSSNATSTGGTTSSNIPVSTGGIAWQHVSVQTATVPPIPLLHDFSYSIENGRFCAILGPSGSGKSTLLRTLAHDQTLPSTGEVWQYGVEDDEAVHSRNQSTKHQRPHTAFVTQHDAFFDQLTVKETIEFASFMEGDDNNIQHSSLFDTFLGLDPSQPVHQLSGGEKRRLSILLELISKATNFLILDEPTSGLDTSMAQQIVQLLKQIASSQNIPLLCSIHQPRSSLWKYFDDIILIYGGEVCYAGTRDYALTHLEKLGYPCPMNTNPADFLIDLVTDEPSRTKLQQHAYISAYREQASTSLSEIVAGGQLNNDSDLASRGKRPNILLRFGALLNRSWKQIIRNNTIHLVKFIGSVGNAVLLAEIFPTVHGNLVRPNSVADRIALLSFGAINMCFFAFLKTVKLFSDERPVIQRELNKKQYLSAEYILAKIIADLPIDALFTVLFSSILKLSTGLRISMEKIVVAYTALTTAGSALGFVFGSIGDRDVATSASIPAIVLLMVVGIINPSGVDPEHPPPHAVQLLKSVSPFAYAIEALAIGEYTGMEFDGKKSWFGRFRELPRLGALAMVKNGEQILEALGLQNQTFESAVQYLSFLTVMFFFTSWIGLSIQQWWHERRRANSHTTGSINLFRKNPATGFRVLQPQ